MPAIAMTPDQILSFWIGPTLRNLDLSETAWRERMLRWRVGVYARNFNDPDFEEVQRKVCEDLHHSGSNLDEFFSPKVLWNTPTGELAKLITLDQFTRCIYRGTPLAYSMDPVVAPILRKICNSGWDISEYNVMERMWVYVAMSHPEDQDIQELSVRKWTQWSADVVAAAEQETRQTNKHVAWYFVKSIIEHSEAVLVHNRFPHRNAIMCRIHEPGEDTYLRSDLRPLWSFTQPPRPSYYIIHSSIHSLGEHVDCKNLTRDNVQEWLNCIDIDPNSLHGFMGIFDHSESVDFNTLFRHLTLSSFTSLFDEIMSSNGIRNHRRNVNRAIFKDPDAPWPPKSSKSDISRIIDIPALVDSIDCPVLNDVTEGIKADSLARFSHRALRQCVEQKQTCRIALKGNAVVYDASFVGLEGNNLVMDVSAVEQDISPCIDGLWHVSFLSKQRAWYFQSEGSDCSATKAGTRIILKSPTHIINNDLRKHLRFTMDGSENLNAHISVDSRLDVVKIIDMSMGGVRVKTEKREELTPGDHVSVQFGLESQLFLVDSEIKRIDGDEIALEFQNSSKIFSYICQNLENRWLLRESLNDFEKRKLPRYTVNLPIVVQILNMGNSISRLNMSGPISGRTLDVSTAGAGIAISAQSESGEEVFTMPDSTETKLDEGLADIKVFLEVPIDDDSVVLEGEPVRLTRGMDSEFPWQIGLEFRNVNPYNRRLLQDYLASEK